ncbi:O-antigen ligase family protein [Faecalibacterium sp.]|uniref:O-antigen ligase family protein n=1 Tax=Faecalibacterium sp. TaxID=1971605 RepID=UPI00399BF52E
MKKEMSVYNILFCIYVFSMPFTNFHPLGLNSVFGAMAKAPAFLVSIIGMVILLIRNKGVIFLDKNGLLRNFVKIVTALNAISIIMAIVLHKSLGILGGETTFDAIAGDIVYWIQVLCIVLFNIMLFRGVDIDAVESVIKKLIYILMAIGYLEMGMVLFGGPFTVICNALYNVGAIYDPESMIRTGKIFLTYSEASYAEIVLGALIWPYLCGKIMGNDADKDTILLLLCTLPLAIINQSSSVLMALGIYAIMLFFTFLRRREISKKKLTAFILVIAGVGLLVWQGRDQIGPLIIEKVFEKPFDQNDYSTIQRSSVVRNCILTFIEYPILGVGNGNQGYFYKGHLTANAYRSYEVQNTLKFQNGVPSAGSWFGGILSGYGIVGIALLSVYVAKVNRIMKSLKGTKWYYIYHMTFLCFLICSWFTASLTGEYLQILFLSIPFFSERFLVYEEKKKCGLQ